MMRGLKDAALSLLHRLFAALAVELKPEAPAGPLLIVAPHADDETLGCAAVMLRAVRAGRRVGVVIVSDGSQSIQSAIISAQQLAAMRVDEAVAAVGAFGVAREDVHFLGFPDSRLDDAKAAVAEALLARIAALNPAEIYVPYGIDGHRDHRAVAAAFDMLLGAGKIACPVYEYPVWFWPWQALRHLAMPRRLLRLRKVATAGCLATKRQAMLSYRSQMENITGEPDVWFLERRMLANFFKPNELFFEKRRPTL